MAKKELESANSITRRKYIQSAGVTGLGSIFATESVSGRGETTKIVTDRARGEPLRTKEVPTKWVEFERKVTKVREQISRDYSYHRQTFESQEDREQTPVVYSIGIGNSDERIGDRFKSNVRLRVDPDGPGLSLPSHIDGVPVEVVEEENTSSPDSCNTDQYTPVPGGVKCKNPRTGGIATTTTKVWKNGSPGLLNCAHIFDQDAYSCDGDLTGLDLEQSGNKMGEVPSKYHYDHREDWAILDKSGNQTNGYALRIENAADEVVGYKTDSGMRDMKSNGEAVYQMGKTTCSTSGEITGVYVEHSGGSGSCFYTNYAVETNTDTENGDSGGPHYDRWFEHATNEYKASIICPHWGSTDTNTWGTAAEHLYKVHDIAFTPP